MLAATRIAEDRSYTPTVRVLVTLRDQRDAEATR